MRFTMYDFQDSIYLFKVNIGDSKTMCGEICSKSTIKTSERRHFGVIIDFE